MANMKPDIEADTKAAEDRAEDVSSMEPLRIGEDSRHRAALADLAVELAAKTAGLRRSLPEGIADALADLVRAMNCYYSNLIEGHDTHPVDIERALNEDFSADPKRRDLQLEAKAHIAVQRWIDEDGLSGRPTDRRAIVALHRRFCERLPESLLWTENPDTGERVPVEPGAFRRRDVKVGRHVPISPGAIQRFLARFEEGHARLGRVDAILAAATAHHRLLWIHPFVDGNGRVARLMSYAMLRDALNTGGLWSIARGLAREESAYKSHLMACDAPRRGDRDGRGALSEAALADFAAFFLKTSIDQVDFMESLIEPTRLRARILLWAEEEMRADALPARSGRVLEAVLFRGTLPRGEAAEILNVHERSARRTTSALLDRGVLNSDSTRAPLRIAFPAALAGRWMPGLFPEKR
jgi:Fic family protein